MLMLLSSLFSASDWMAPESRSNSRPSSSPPLPARDGIGALDVLAQGVEFAPHARRHLMAQFLAQALQLAGDLADGGDAVFLAAHALDVAGDRLVGLVVGAAGFRARAAAAARMRVSLSKPGP